MAARRVELRDDAHVGSGVEGLDGGAHPRAAGPDDHDVVHGIHSSGRYLMGRSPDPVRATG
jgi:hypothetical protein